jgi:hypothetical protein
MKGVTAEEHRFTGVCVLVSRLSDKCVFFIFPAYPTSLILEIVTEIFFGGEFALRSLLPVQ